MLTHPLITRSIEQAQKRVELQNFQSRKRLLEYDDVMNQQREVIYSLRAFALEGGEELKGEALKMIEKAVSRRVETVLAEYEDGERVGLRPAASRICSCTTCCRCRSSTNADHAADGCGGGAGRRRSRRRRKAFCRQAREPRRGARRDGQRLRRPPAVARHAQRAGREVEGSPLRSRPAAQRDPLPLVGPEGSAHRVQAGSVHDVRGPDERHLQHVHRAIPQGAARVRGAGRASRPPAAGAGGADEALQRARRARGRSVDDGEPTATGTERGRSTSDRPRRRREKPVAARSAIRSIVGAGRARSAERHRRRGRRRPVDWTNVGRNDPCPCGSGKKFKKCHGATL